MRSVGLLDKCAGCSFVGWMSGPLVCWMDVRFVGLLVGCAGGRLSDGYVFGWVVCRRLDC